MERKNVKFILIICAVLLFFAAAIVVTKIYPAKDKNKPTEVKDAGIIHEPEFGGAYIKLTIDEFNELGYEYGDSVRVEFSNGYIMDVPYYNGYYVENGAPLLVAYPGYDYIKACISNGDDLWVTAGLSENDTASISLIKRGQYLDTQKARDIHYEDDREKYESDIVFANFRSLKGGKLKENIVYRSASPCDNQHNRAPFADKLAEEAGVRYILDLADTPEKIDGYIGKDDFDSPHFLSLYKEGNVKPLSVNANYSSDEFKQKIADGLKSVAEHEGPFLIHCTEGKDRTGYLAVLIEAFAGATYEEIKTDYMITYDNYYGINETTDKEKYDIIVESLLNPIIESIAPDTDIKTADLSKPAEELLRNAGLTDTDIENLRKALTD